MKLKLTTTKKREKPKLFYQLMKKRERGNEMIHERVYLYML